MREVRVRLTRGLGGNDRPNLAELFDPSGGLPDRGLRLRDGRSRFGIVQLHDHVPGADPLTLSKPKRDNAPGCLRGKLHTRGDKDSPAGDDVLLEVRSRCGRCGDDWTACPLDQHNNGDDDDGEDQPDAWAANERARMK